MKRKKESEMMNSLLLLYGVRENDDQIGHRDRLGDGERKEAEKRFKVMVMAVPVVMLKVKVAGEPCPCP